MQFTTKYRSGFVLLLLCLSLSCVGQVSFTSQQLRGFPLSTAETLFKLVDVDSDGDLDIFTGLYFGINNKGAFDWKPITVFEERQDGGRDSTAFVNLIRNGVYTVLELDDTNGDGIYELFLYNTQEDRIVVKVNYQKNFTFFDNGLVFKGYSALALLDADNDGYKDYVVGNKEEMVIYQNTRFYGREYILLYQYRYRGATKPAGTTTFFIQDFNQDGELDVFNGSTFFYKKASKIDFVVTEPLLYKGVPFSIKNCHFADVSNTAHPVLMGEIAYNASKIPYTSYAIGAGDTSFHMRSQFGSIDMDNDGYLDVIFKEQDTLRYQSGKTGAQTILNKTSSIPVASIFYAGDLDQDGHLQLFGVSNNKLYRWKNKQLNQAPELPLMSIEYDEVNNSIVVNWSPIENDETPSRLIRYNLTVNGNDVIVHKPFPIIYSEVGRRPGQPNGLEAQRYIRTSSFAPNMGYLLEKRLVINCEADTITVVLTAVDNQGRLSVPDFRGDSSIIAQTLRPFQFRRDSLALGAPRAAYQVLALDVDGSGSKEILLQQAIGKDPALAYFPEDKKSMAFATSSRLVTVLNREVPQPSLPVLLQNTSSHVLEQHVFDPSAQSFGVASIGPTQKAASFVYPLDIDADGDLDLFGAEHDSLDVLDTQKDLYVLTQTNIGLLRRSIKDTLVLFSSDFNNDGEKDWVVCCKQKEAFSLSILAKKGDRYVAFQTDLHVLNEGTQRLSQVAFYRFDVDGDGDFELVILEKEAGNCVIFERNSTGFYQQVYKKTNANLVFFDYNNDALIDFLDLSSKNIYLNNGAYNFGPLRYIPTLGNLSFAIASGEKGNYKSTIAVDYDNDSLTDLVAVDHEGVLFFRNSQTVYKNKPPTQPRALQAHAFEDTCRLQWAASEDLSKVSSGVFYHVVLWKKGADGFVCPPIALENGHLLMDGQYNALSNTMVLRHLEEGTYCWKVQAIDQSFLGSSFSEVDTFRIRLVPKLVQKTSDCQDAIVTYSVAPASQRYRWWAEDAVKMDSTEESITLRWKKAGTKQLVVQNTKFGFSDTTSVTVKANEVPSIHLQYPERDSRLLVKHEAEVAQVVATYKWQMEGKSFQSPSVDYTYTLYGAYPLQLDVTYANGCKQTALDTVQLFGPIVRGASKACTGTQSVYSVDPKGYKYEWRTASGQLLSEKDNFSMQWSDTAQNTLLIVTNVALQRHDSLLVEVSPSPKARFMTPDNLHTGEMIQLHDASLGEISNYLWEFGELDKAATQQHPVYTFEIPGQHLVRLTVGTPQGCKHTVATNIIVAGEAQDLLIGNLISPNGDNKNDQLYIEHLERYPENEVVLYAAWGKEVFRKQNYTNDWPGFGDEPLLPGNYLCTVEVKQLGKKIEKIVSVVK